MYQLTVNLWKEKYFNQINVFIIEVLQFTGLKIDNYIQFAIQVLTRARNLVIVQTPSSPISGPGRLSIMPGDDSRRRVRSDNIKLLNMSDTDDEELDKEAVGKKIAEELPPEILQEYKDIFSFFDRDGGGSIGAEEFDQVMRTFGWEPKDEELKEMVSVIDQVR